MIGAKGHAADFGERGRGQGRDRGGNRTSRGVGRT
ncbi:predicted protein [Streptomyces filamentosus NRRL 15998]|uniref:Predicted protein n=1 Tax=Streptomyces filamentosus NRRL 15998 TaxID=457431 RepID=D6AL11_STRFL|nr:predicted protein [Streptomyces filamentosus NRRL 15998]